jgi:hypothetical protein
LAGFPSLARNLLDVLMRLPYVVQRIPIRSDYTHITSMKKSIILYLICALALCLALDGFVSKANASLAVAGNSTQEGGAWASFATAMAGTLWLVIRQKWGCRRRLASSPRFH